MKLQGSSSGLVYDREGRQKKKTNINCDIPIPKYYATMKNDAIEKKKISVRI